MRYGQYSGRLRRIEKHAAERQRAAKEAKTSGRVPITLRQLHGLEPISASENEALRRWMLEHG